MECGLPDGGEADEHIAVDFLEISKIFAMQDKLHFEMELSNGL